MGFRGRLLRVAGIVGILGLSALACTPDSDTISSLVDLTASTSGGLAEILVKAAINALLNIGSSTLDLLAPISQQLH